MDRLKNKVAVISGAARGQGAAEAKMFTDEGAKVVIGDVLDRESQALASEINKKAGSRVSFALHLDVTRGADWRTAIEEAEREFGGVDILVNNAGILNFKTIEETSEEEFDGVVAVNQKGVWLGMKHVVPAMRKRGGGSIVNISSIYGIIGSAGAAAYHGTKGAVRIMSKVGAVHYAPDNIRVNSVHPGVIKTPMVDILSKEEASFVTGAEFVVDGGYTAV
jgi:NAD(P)-dependent dehydrogenase (short-subunit alcohol dehydrogenase family)